MIMITKKSFLPENVITLTSLRHTTYMSIVPVLIKLRTGNKRKSLYTGRLLPYRVSPKVMTHKFINVYKSFSILTFVSMRNFQTISTSPGEEEWQVVSSVSPANVP